jgi:predicted TIM-barrel fold metal-dependent hydrolase
MTDPAFLDARGRPRVAVTGLGVKTPAGTDVAAMWETVVAAVECAAAPIERFDASELPVRFAGEVRDFDAADYFGPKEARRQDRVTQLGFVGCLLNPDPYENSGHEAPPLGDRYWYPLYEKLCELDVPAHIHGTGSRSERSPYSVHFINEETIAVFGLVNSTVFKDFPNLKIVVSHGGGAVPYQLGRFEAPTLRRGTGERFSAGARKLYYDTVLYTEEALRLLIKTVGVDRCLFGTECPGVGSSVDPASGRSMDNVRPMIENIEWLNAEDKQRIFCDNAKAVFKLKV